MQNIEQIYAESVKKIANIKTDSVKKIYFMGIKGVGMTALALIAKQAGFSVRGCDTAQEFITDKALHDAAIEVDTGFDVESIISFVGDSVIEEVMLVVTGAHGGLSNPVAEWATAKGIQIVTQGQAVGLFMQGNILRRPGLTGISVAGSHGKTTITAMLATMLTEVGKDPSYVIGTGETTPLGAPGHFGSGQEFVAEADEYASDIHYDPTPKLFYQQPQYAVINNIDFDHPDFYQSINEVESVFRVFMHNITQRGTVIVNGDDQRIRGIIAHLSQEQVFTYGEDENNDVVLSHFVQKDTESEFDVLYKGQQLGKFRLHVLGIHNALNSLAVIGVGLQLGLSSEQISEGLAAFRGSKRRMEIMGTTKNGVIIIDDYAHHPREIETTLSSLKAAYPDKKVVCIFQPHTYSRTESLLSEFATSLLQADELIVLPVFVSAREANTEDTVSQRLIQTIQEKGKQVLSLEGASDVIEYVTKNYLAGEYIILTIGAGDIYKIAVQLAERGL